MTMLLAVAQSSTPMLASQPAFSLIVKGSVIGLTVSVIMLLVILGYEWWKGHVW